MVAFDLEVPQDPTSRSDWLGADEQGDTKIEHTVRSGGEEENEKLLAIATTVVVGTVHRSLLKIPRRTGRNVAYAILGFNVLFVGVMTAYSYVFNCSTSIAVVDADWTNAQLPSNDATPSVTTPFNPYEMLTGEGSYICTSLAPMSLIINETTGETSDFYIVPCLLTGLQCDDYSDKRCPQDVKQQFHPCEGESRIEGPTSLCLDWAPLASIVTVVCPSLFIAFSSAIGPVAYIQAAILLIFFGCYFFCCKKLEDKDDIKDVLEGLF